LDTESALIEWRAANQLIRQFPADPSMEAARRAHAAQAIGDMFNFDLWTRINKAVLALERQGPKDGDTVN
jgi:hypothetical protein